MSLTTLLLAFLPAIVSPKREPEKSDRERELEGEIARLLQLNERAAGRIELLEVERDSWRRRYEDAAASLARVTLERIPPSVVEREHRLALARYAAMQQQAQQAMAYQQGLANPVAQAQYHQMQAMQNAYNVPHPFGELVDCTGGGRSRHLTGILGAIGGA